MTDRALPPHAEKLLEQMGWIYGFAHQLIGDPGVADDVSQEAILAALKRVPEEGTAVDPDPKLKAWLKAVIRNQASKARRSDQRRRRRERKVAAPEVSSPPADLIERAELQQALIDAIMKLDEPYREVLLLRFFEGYEIRDIARQRGVSEATLRSQISRGLEKVRTQLDKRSGGREGWYLGCVAFVASPPAGLFELAGSHAVFTEILSAGPPSKIASSAAGAALTAGGIVMSIKLVAVATLVTAGVVCGLVFFNQPGTLGHEQVSQPGVENAQVSTESGDRSTDRPSLLAAEGSQDASGLADESRQVGASTQVIRGRVLNDEGTPLAGVTVTAGLQPKQLVEGLHGLPFEIDMDLSQVVAKASGGLPSAETNAEGLFELPVEKPGYYRVTAQGLGYQPGVKTLTVEESRVDSLEFRLSLGLTITGIVVDPSGRPVSGATVSCSGNMLMSSGNGTGIIIGVSTSVPGVPRGNSVETVTDDQGFFEVVGLRSGNYVLGSDVAPHGPSLLKEVAAGSRDVELRLRVPVSISGRVLDQAGEPVADAKVSTFDVDSAGNRNVVTDKDGAYQLERLAPSELISILVNAECCPQLFESADLSNEQSLTGLNLTLQQGATIRGICLDPNGQPLPGVRVSVESARRFEATAFRSAAGVNEGEETGADGLFEIRALKAGEEYVVQLVHPGYLEEIVEGVVAELPDTDLGLISMQTGGTISGRVTQAKDGQPLEGVRVALLEHSDDEPGFPGLIGIDFGLSTKSAKTDENGRFTFEAVPAGSFKVGIRHKGFVPFQGDPLIFEASSHFTDIACELEAGLEITGTVVDGTGTPVAGAQVFASRFMPTMSSSRAVSDSSGRFTLTGLEEGAYDVQARYGNYAPGRQQGAVAGGEPIILTMSGLGSLIGRVYDIATGEPVTEFSLRLDKKLEDQMAGLMSGDIAGLLAGSQSFKDAAGEFIQADVVPGVYTVNIQARGFVTSQEHTVSIREGEESRIEIGLEIGGAIEGIVTDEKGLPVPNVAVTTGKGTGSRFGMEVVVAVDGGQTTNFMSGGDEVLTDEEGRFLISGLASGKVDLSFAHDEFLDYTQKGIEVSKGQTTRSKPIKLERGATLTGTVYDDEGAPVTRGLVMLTRIPGKDEKASNGRTFGLSIGGNGDGPSRFGGGGSAPKIAMIQEGRFKSSGLKAGKYRLRPQRIGSGGFSFNSDATGGTEVDIKPGETREIRLTLPTP